MFFNDTFILYKFCEYILFFFFDYILWNSLPFHSISSLTYRSGIDEVSFAAAQMIFTKHVEYALQIVCMYVCMYLLVLLLYAIVMYVYCMDLNCWRHAWRIFELKTVLLTSFFQIIYVFILHIYVCIPYISIYLSSIDGRVLGVTLVLVFSWAQHFWDVSVLHSVMALRQRAPGTQQAATWMRWLWWRVELSAPSSAIRSVIVFKEGWI